MWPPLYKIFPLLLTKGFAQKGLNACHPERSEGSGGGGGYVCTASPADRFFVTSFLRMTFEARRLLRERGIKRDWIFYWRIIDSLSTI